MGDTRRRDAQKKGKKKRDRNKSKAETSERREIRDRRLKDKGIIKERGQKKVDDGLERVSGQSGNEAMEQLDFSARPQNSTNSNIPRIPYENLKTLNPDNLSRKISDAIDTQIRNFDEGSRQARDKIARMRKLVNSENFNQDKAAQKEVEDWIHGQLGSLTEDLADQDVTFQNSTIQFAVDSTKDPNTEMDGLRFADGNLEIWSVKTTMDKQNLAKDEKAWGRLINALDDPKTVILTGDNEQPNRVLTNLIRSGKYPEPEFKGWSLNESEKGRAILNEINTQVKDKLQDTPAPDL